MNFIKRMYYTIQMYMARTSWFEAQKSIHDKEHRIRRSTEAMNDYHYWDNKIWALDTEGGSNEI